MIWLLRPDCKQCAQKALRKYKQSVASKQVPDAPDYGFPEQAPITSAELKVVENARCKGDHRFLMAPERGEYHLFKEMWTGLEAVCDACPVKSMCRAEGDRREEFGGMGTNMHTLVGFLAGETPNQRARRRKEKRIGFAA